MHDCKHKPDECRVEKKLDIIESKLDCFIERISKVESSVNVVKGIFRFLVIPIIIIFITTKLGM